MVLNLNICAKCPSGTYEPSRLGKDGRMTRAPSVDCDVEGTCLSAGDEVPLECPYILEHALTEDEGWDGMEAVKSELEDGQ